MLPVILYHAGIGPFSGGYVGVDIFFVISGYLITSIILSEIREGDFSIVRFYERRARRILPALFFVLFCCLPVAWYWMLPDELEFFGLGLVAAGLFVSNVLFWRTTNYFAPTSEELPLIHTWSLAVEEQYYLIFPLVLLGLWRFGWKQTKLAIVLLLIVSMAMCEWGWRNQPVANFYLLPTRSWELLVGSLLAIAVSEGHVSPLARSGHLVRSLLPGVGFLLIIISVLLFDDKTPFPSFYAILPTGGAGLIIAFSSKNDAIGRLLSSRLLVFIGLISYSAYLWHQPIFVFTRTVWIASPHIEWLMLGAVCATLVLASFSLHFVERRFRSKAVSRKSIAVFSILGIAATLLVGWALASQKGYGNRFEAALMEELKKYEVYDKGWREGECFIFSQYDAKEAFDEKCYGESVLKPKIYLIGDSHAAALYPGIVGLLPEGFELAQLTMSGCPPVLGHAFNGPARCERLSDDRFARIEGNESSYVILDANWPSHYKHDELALLENGVRDTVRALSERIPSERVIVVGNVPVWPRSLPKLLAQNGVLGGVGEPDYAFNGSLADRRRYDMALQRAAQSSGATFFSVIDSMCVETNCRVRLPVGDGRFELTTFDYGHLTHAGAEHVVRRLIGNR